MNLRNPWMSQRLVHKVLKQASLGRLVLTLPDGRDMVYGGKAPGPEAVIQVLDNGFFPKVVRYGDIGFGEAYVDGFWETPDLISVFSFFLFNKPTLSPFRALGIPGWIEKGLYWLNRASSIKNTIAGSRKNIRAHYDLSNDLFEKFLDPSLVYSAAVFADPTRPCETLEEAQLRKLRIMAEKANLRPGMSVLEIGCGWGGFAVLAAKEFQCSVTAITVSQKQYDYTRELIRKQGLEDKVEVRLTDYRTLKGRFDAIVSIEMLEAVGHEFHPDFARCLDRLLAPQGRVAIQVITIHDQRYNDYRWEGDWVRKHIFPGGLLPSLTRLCQVFTKHSELRLINVENFGDHYVPTLAVWREQFLKAWPDIAALGFKENFRRAWTYYFSICEAGFSTGHIDNLQIVLERPSCRDCWSEKG